MTPPGMRSATLARCSATWRLSASSSSPQGPAMTNSASSRNTRSLIIPSAARERRHGFAPLFLGLHRRGNESGEERVGAGGTRLELGMELTAEVPRVLRIFDDLDELSVGADTAEAQTVL